MDPDYLSSLNTLLEAFGSSLLDAGQNLHTVTEGLKMFNDAAVNTQYGIGKVLSIQEKWDSGIESLVENMTFLEERNSELNKTLGVSSATAEGYAKKIRDLGQTINFSDETLFKFTKGLNDLTGGMLMTNNVTDDAKNSLFAFQATAVEALGMTEEAAQGFETYARLVGTSGTAATVALQSMANVISDKTGIDQLSIQRDIMQEIGSLSSDVRMNYSKMPGNLEVAVLKAKALGFTMDQLDKAGESLMDVEQSVGNELEYQLLTGQRLLADGNKSFTNEYRKAKLMGDAKKQAELMGDILEKQGKTLKTNYMARQKFAEMMGMSSEELSKALEKQTIAQELGATQLMKLSGKELTSEIDKLRSEYKAGGKEGADKLKALNKFLEANDTRTTHEKVVEDNLVTIAKTIGDAVGSRKVVAETAKKLRTIDPVTGKATGDIKKTYDVKKTDMTAQIDNLAKVSARSELMAINKSVRDYMIGAYSGPMAGSMEKVSKNIVKHGSGNFNYSTGGKGKGKGAKTATDTVIYPDGAAPVVLDKKDTVYAMRPGDKFDKQLNKSHRDAFAAGERVAQQSFAGNQISRSNKPNDNSMSMIAAALQRIGNNNTSAPSLDVTALASAIATAMQSVKIEAKVRTDDMYSSNRMNNRKNII
jgi:hypothetical protein